MSLIYGGVVFRGSSQTLKNSPDIGESMIILSGNTLAQRNLVFTPKLAIRATITGGVGSYDPYEILAYIQGQKKEDEMLRVLQCESGLDNSRIGKAGEVGVAQFMPKTWEWFNELRETHLDIHNLNDQLNMFVWAFENGYAENWTCWRNLCQTHY